MFLDAQASQAPTPDRGGRYSLFLTMQCFQILNDAIFRRCSEKNIDLDVFDDVRKKLKHRAHDAY